VSAVLPVSSYLAQPPLPSPGLPPGEESWTEWQPGLSKKPPRPVAEGGFWNREKQQAAPEWGRDALNETYIVDDRASVMRFISENRLLGLLIQARRPLNDVFGEAAIKKLTLAQDDEGHEILFCLVLVPGEMQLARQALRRFDQRWWVVRSHHAAGRLNFDFELV
jgi:hypothetical protein